MKRTKKPAPTDIWTQKEVVPPYWKTLDFHTDVVGGLFNNTNFGHEIEHFFPAGGLAAGTVHQGPVVLDAIEEAAHYHGLQRTFSKEIEAARALLTERGCRVVI